MGRDPKLLGGLKGQDYNKAIVLGFLVGPQVLSAAGGELAAAGVELRPWQDALKEYLREA